MKKIQILGLALVAVAAFSAFAATSAFAVSKFLYANAEITAELATTIEGELLLEDTKAPIKDDVKCSGIFDGTIEAGGVLGLVLEVLMLNGELLAATVNNLALVLTEGDDIECTGSSGEACLVVALNLPWHTEIVLILGVYRLDFLADEAGKVPEYNTDCETIFGLVEDICDGLSEAFLTNVVGTGVLAAFTSESPKTSCSLGGENSGALESLTDSFVKDATQSELTLSEN
jgi:hypothetical protein